MVSTSASESRRPEGNVKFVPLAEIRRVISVVEADIPNEVYAMLFKCGNVQFPDGQKAEMREDAFRGGLRRPW